MKKKQFLAAMENAGIPAKLSTAVIRQLGYTSPTGEELGCTLSDIANHGINGGYHGFIYYTDTNAFFARNKAAIVCLAEQMAEDVEQGTVEMVCGFNCLKAEGGSERRILEGEVARALYGRVKKDDYLNVPNALAWFAGEEVARAWSYFAYENKLN